jgi:RNA polymerase sigma-70 factor, ECF subfamily
MERALMPEYDNGRSRSDTAPVRAAEAGAGAAGSAAFEAVFTKHYRRLVRSLALACGNQDLAADLVQQAFAQLWAEWPRISKYESPSTWVARVAISRLRDHQRSLRRRAAALLRLEAMPVPSPPEAGLGVDIRAALARLPLKQRIAVVLFYLDDRPVVLIANMMGVSEGTVNQHLFRARETLRGLLEED